MARNLQLKEKQMALPLIAAGIAARAVAKKLASRAAGGITGAGAKQVTPVYREMGTGSVNVVSNKGMQKEYNQLKTGIAEVRKSGKLAKDVAKNQETKNLQGILSGKTGDPKVIKINSNPGRGK
jgi:hypothetical protein